MISVEKVSRTFCWFSRYSLVNLERLFLLSCRVLSAVFTPKPPETKETSAESFLLPAVNSSLLSPPSGFGLVNVGLMKAL